MEWEARRGGGIRGGEQHRRFFGNICGERKKSCSEKEMVCGGRQRADGDCGGCLLELGYFVYGRSGVGTCGQWRLGRRGERNGGVRCGRRVKNQPRRKKGTW